MSEIELDGASVELSEPRPNVSSTNFRTLPNVYSVCATLCGFAYGDITIIGTRKPSRVYQTCGGGTLSYQPPQSSQRTIMAVSFQYWLVPIALTTLVIQRGPPLQPLPG